MDLDIFAPDYKKEQRALEKAHEMLARASKLATDKKDGAVELYKEALRFIDSKKELMVQHRDGFSDCYLEIGRALRANDQKEEAFRSLESAVEVAPDRAPAWMELGKVLLEEGKFESAAGYLDRALLLAPQEADAWVAKGNAMRSLMEFDEARMCYAKALQLEPLKLEGYDLLLTIAPNDPEVLRGKAVALSLRGQHEAALDIFKQALSAAPGNPAVLTEMGKALGRSGRREEALAFFDRAAQSNPGFKMAYSAKGRVLAELGKKEEAIKAHEAALRLDPLDREALSGLAEALMALGRHAEALDSIGRAQELGPRDMELMLKKGAALSALGREAEAAKSYEDAITTAPEDPRGWAGKGRSLAGAGMSEGALPYFEKAAALDPDNPVYAYWKGLALAVLDRHEEAVASFNAALDHDAESATATAARAESLLALGRLDEAVRGFNRAGVLDPKNKAVWLGRARCAMRQETFDEAAGYLDKALELYPADPAALAMRKEARELKEKQGLESCARVVLDYEQRSGRMPTREEAFRDCKVQLEQLDKVMAHLEAPEKVEPSRLLPSEREELDALSTDLIRRAQPGGPIRLSDAVKHLRGTSVLRAKRVLGYIEAVRVMRPALEAPLDPRTEERSRAGLHLPEGERDLFSLVRKLNIGLAEARRVELVMDALRTGVPLPAPPMVEEPSAAAEVPESELEVTADLRTPQKRPRRPRRRPEGKMMEKAPAAPMPPEKGHPASEEKGPAGEAPQRTDEAAEDEGEEAEGEPAEKGHEEEEEGAEEEEGGEGAEEAAPVERRPARRPRRRAAGGAPPSPDGGGGEEEEGAEAEEAGGEEGPNEKQMEDLSESIKDIVSSIEKREVKRGGAEERPDDRSRGRAGRTYCSVCHSIIATIHHGCGAHLCSRCVIDFNKDRRAPKNLCPKCLKPIETVPPPGGSRGSWRDTL